MTLTGATPSAPGREAGAEAGRDAPPRGPGRPRNEQASTAIAEAALRQLGECGFAKVTMESVAGEAGVARATIYRRYRDKADQVTAAIAANSTTHLAGGPSDDPRGDLIAYLNEFDRRFGESCLEVVGTLIGMREDPGALDLHRQRVVGPRMAYSRGLLERARDLGQLRADADLDLALQMLTGSVFGRRITGQPSRAGWAERAVDAIWTGMGPEPAPPAGRSQKPGNTRRSSSRASLSATAAEWSGSSRP
jgi:AcrR family transcriptional regulator